MHDDTAGQVTGTNGQCITNRTETFPPLPSVPKLPKGFNTYMETVLPKASFDKLFKEFKPRMKPQGITLGYNMPRGINNEIYNFIIKIQSYMMKGLEPLFSLKEGSSPESSSKCIDLIAISIAQALVQLNNVRRILVLDETWGAGTRKMRSDVLRRCYDQKVFKADDLMLFNREFEDIANDYQANLATDADISGQVFEPKGKTSVERYRRYRPYRRNSEQRHRRSYYDPCVDGTRGNNSRY